MADNPAARTASDRPAEEVPEVQVVETDSLAAPSEGPSSLPTERPASSVKPWLRETFNVVTVLAISATVALIVRIAIAQAYEVEGPSMEPTLRSGETLFVARCAYGLALPGLADTVVSWALPAIGDVVILASPQNPEEDLVKRVIGLPGDRIEVIDDVVHRNGAPMRVGEARSCLAERFHSPLDECRTFTEHNAERRWHTGHSYLEWNQTLPPVRVPDDQIYVLGDHRTRSNDSRIFGTVPISLLRGRVLFTD